MGKKQTVRKHLFLDDIKVLMKLRGMKDNSFTPLVGTDPIVYRPRTTIKEWSEIKDARQKRKEKHSKEDKPKLTKSESNYIRKICGNQSIKPEQKANILTKHFGIDISTLSSWIKLMGLSLAPTQFSRAKFHRLKKRKRYLISSAQNASHANIDLLENMKVYAKFIGAEIGIIATRYRNPTSTWHAEDEKNDVWDDAVQEFLTAKRQNLHPDLTLLADLKVQATAPNPTNGIELFGGHRSCIVGSPRIEMRSVAVLDDQKQKFLYSTGSVTAPSFTDSVAGGKAGEHHSYGFVVVEIESCNVVHVRNVSAHKDGSFNDLIFRVENGNVTKENIECFVWGDSHFAQKDESVTEAFRGLCDDLGIEMSVLHDIWDSESINVHNIHNPVIQHELMMEGRDDLQKEIDQMFEELDWFNDNMKHTIVVASNHDDMLDRAMIKSDWRDNLKNAKIFVDFLQLTLSHKAKDGVIPYLINNRYDGITALGVDDSYIHNGIELALHGHKGPNGSRGNILAFSKLSTKTIIGHSHTPGIRWGCYQVGISCGLKHGYNKGLSGWAYAGCTLNKRGKRQLITLNRNTLTYTTLI